MRAYLYGITLQSNREIRLLSEALISGQIVDSIRVIDQLSVEGDGYQYEVPAFSNYIYTENGIGFVEDYTVSLSTALSEANGWIFLIDSVPLFKETAYNRLAALRDPILTSFSNLSLGTIMNQHDMDSFFGNIIMPRTKLFSQFIIGSCNWIDENVTIDWNVNIGSFCYIGAHSYIGPEVVIGSKCYLYPGTIVHSGISVGNDSYIRGHITQDVPAGTRMP